MGTGVSLEAASAACVLGEAKWVDWAARTARERAATYHDNPLKWEGLQGDDAGSSPDAASEAAALLSIPGGAADSVFTEEERGVLAGVVDGINGLYCAASRGSGEDAAGVYPYHSAFATLMKQQIPSDLAYHQWMETLRSLRAGMHTAAVEFVSDEGNSARFAYVLPEATRKALQRDAPERAPSSEGDAPEGGHEEESPDQEAAAAAPQTDGRHTPAWYASAAASVEHAYHGGMLFLRCRSDKDLVLHVLSCFCKTLGKCFKKLSTGPGFACGSVEVPCCIDLQVAGHSYLCVAEPREEINAFDGTSLAAEAFEDALCAESGFFNTLGVLNRRGVFDIGLNGTTGIAQVLPAARLLEEYYLRCVAGGGDAAARHSLVALSVVSTALGGMEATWELVRGRLEEAVDLVYGVLATFVATPFEQQRLLGALFHATQSADYASNAHCPDPTKAAIRKLLFVEVVAQALKEAWLCDVRAVDGGSGYAEKALAACGAVLKRRDKAFWEKRVVPVAKDAFGADIGSVELSKDVIKAVMQRYCGACGLAMKGGQPSAFADATLELSPYVMSSPAMLSLFFCDADELGKRFMELTQTDAPPPYCPLPLTQIHRRNVEATIETRRAQATKSGNALGLFVPLAALCSLQGGDVAADARQAQKELREGLAESLAAAAGSFHNRISVALIEHTVRSFVLEAVVTKTSASAMPVYAELYDAAAIDEILSSPLHGDERLTAAERRLLRTAEREGMQLCGAVLSEAGELLLLHGQYKEAEETLREAVRLLGRTGCSDDSRIAKNNLGVALYSQGAARRPDAAVVYRELLAEEEAHRGEADPKNVSALNNLASLLFYTDEPQAWAEAEDLYTKALKLCEMPPDPAAAQHGPPGFLSPLSDPLSIETERGTHSMKKNLRVIRLKRGTWASVRIQCMFRRFMARRQIKNMKGYTTIVGVRVPEGGSEEAYSGVYVLLPTAQWGGTQGVWVQAAASAPHIIVARGVRYGLMSHADAEVAASHTSPEACPASPELADWGASGDGGVRVVVYGAKDAVAAEEAEARQQAEREEETGFQGLEKALQAALSGEDAERLAAEEAACQKSAEERAEAEQKTAAEHADLVEAEGKGRSGVAAEHDAETEQLTLDEAAASKAIAEASAMDDAARKEEEARIAAEKKAEEEKLAAEAEAQRVEEERLAAEAEARKLQEEAELSAKALAAELAEAEQQAATAYADLLEAEGKGRSLITDERDAGTTSLVAEEAAALKEAETQRLAAMDDAARKEEEARIAAEKQAEEEKLAVEAEAQRVEEERLAAEAEAAHKRECARAAELAEAEQKTAAEHADLLEAESKGRSGVAAEHDAETEQLTLDKAAASKGIAETQRLAAMDDAARKEEEERTAAEKKAEEEKLAAEAEAQRVEEERLAADRKRQEEADIAAKALAAELAEAEHKVVTEHADLVEAEGKGRSGVAAEHDAETEQLTLDEAAASKGIAETQRLAAMDDAARKEEEARIAAEKKAEEEKLAAEAEAQEERLAAEAEAAHKRECARAAELAEAEQKTAAEHADLLEAEGKGRSGVAAEHDAETEQLTLDEAAASKGIAEAARERGALAHLAACAEGDRQAAYAELLSEERRGRACLAAEEALAAVDQHSEPLGRYLLAAAERIDRFLVDKEEPLSQKTRTALDTASEEEDAQRRIIDEASSEAFANMVCAAPPSPPLPSPSFPPPPSLTG